MTDMNTMIEISAVLIGYGSIASVLVVGGGYLFNCLLELDTEDVTRLIRKTKRTIRRLLTR